MSALLSVAQVAARLGVGRRRVVDLIREGRVPAEKVGRSYVVRADDLAGYAPRPAGAPRKTSADRP